MLRSPSHFPTSVIGARLTGFAAYSFLWPAIGLTRSLYLKELYVDVHGDGRDRSAAGRALVDAIRQNGLPIPGHRAGPPPSGPRRRVPGYGQGRARGAPAPRPRAALAKPGGSDGKLFVVAALRSGCPGIVAAWPGSLRRRDAPSSAPAPRRSLAARWQ